MIQEMNKMGVGDSKFQNLNKKVLLMKVAFFIQLLVIYQNSGSVQVRLGLVKRKGVGLGQMKGNMLHALGVGWVRLKQ